MQDAKNDSFQRRLDELNAKVDALPLPHRGPLRAAIFDAQKQHAKMQDAIKWAHAIDANRQTKRPEESNVTG